MLAMSGVWRVSISLILAAVRVATGQTPPADAPAPAPPPAPDTTERIPWSQIDEAERRMMTEQLASPHWPYRVFALMRLERYSGAELGPFIETAVADPAWQVRCFATRQARRLGHPLVAERFDGEMEGLVIRTALRFGVAISPERLEVGARTLMRTHALDQLLLGLEIAAASDVESIRHEGMRRTARLIRNMDESISMRASRRLARIVGLARPLETPQAWREWLKDRGREWSLALPSDGSRETAGPRSLVADMDAPTFSRLMEYMDSLRERDLDLVIVMDSTYSMLPMINEARTGVESLILFLNDVSRAMRLAFVAYRDHDNEPVWEGQAFTTDVDAVRDFLFNLAITGGRDLPEAVLDGLTACGQLDWNPKAVRQIVLVGDARPHDDDAYKLTSLLESYSGRGIVVHAVHVPMEINRNLLGQMSPGQLAAYRAEIAEHNRLTELAFVEVARLGGGDAVTLREAEALVPSVMHLTIEEAWWSAFDEFYTLYLDLCR
jgi:Mg-chelatase subunit ChlD